MHLFALENGVRRVIGAGLAYFRIWEIDVLQELSQRDFSKSQTQSQTAIHWRSQVCDSSSESIQGFIPEIGGNLNIQLRDRKVSDEEEECEEFISAPIGSQFSSDFYFAFGDVDPVFVSPPMIFDLDGTSKEVE